MSGIIVSPLGKSGQVTNERTGIIGHKHGQIIQIQHKRVTASGSGGQGAFYAITSDSFIPLSARSTIKIETVCGFKANTEDGRPLAVGRLRWSGYDGGSATEEFSGCNDWGERTPNYDGNDRAQVDFTQYHYNQSKVARTYSLYLYSEATLNWGTGDTVNWDSGDLYMILTEIAGPPPDAASNVAK